jgi:hypothetical protein
MNVVLPHQAYVISDEAAKLPADTASGNPAFRVPFLTDIQKSWNPNRLKVVRSMPIVVM